jgi:hypothetical protein
VRAHGFELRELDFGELFGKGGGGPRCLVNELRGLPEIPDALSFQKIRPSLAARVAKYPSSSAPA